MLDQRAINEVITSLRGNPTPSPPFPMPEPTRTSDAAAYAAKIADPKKVDGSYLSLEHSERESYDRLGQMAMATFYISDAHRAAMLSSRRKTYELRHEDVDNERGLAYVIQSGGVFIGPENESFRSEDFVSPYPVFTIVVTDAQFLGCCERHPDAHGNLDSEDEHLVRIQEYRCAHDPELDAMLVIAKEETRWTNRGYSASSYRASVVAIEQGRSIVALSAQMAKALNLNGDSDETPCNYRMMEIARWREETASVGIGTCLLLNSTRSEVQKVDDPAPPMNRQQRKASKTKNREHYVVSLRKGRISTALRHSLRGTEVRFHAPQWVRSHLRHYSRGLVVRVKAHTRYGQPASKARYDAMALRP